jgi:hypothetical protein
MESCLMSPTIRRLAAVVASLVLLVAHSPIGPIGSVRAGVAPGSPPAPTAFEANTIGVFAGPGDIVDFVAIIWDEIIDPTSLPAPTDFSVTVNGGAPVAPVAVEIVHAGFAGEAFFGHPGGVTFMRLHLDFAWSPEDEELRLSYTPGQSPVRDFARNEAEPFADRFVEAFDFEEFWAFAAGVDEAYGRSHVLLAVSMPLDDASIPDPADFSVHFSNQAPWTSVTSVSIVHADTGLGILELGILSAINDSDLELELSYEPGDAPLRSARDGTELEAFTLPIFLLLASNSASGTVAPGGAVSTATADGPTPSDPVATTVTSPTGGAVSIAEGPVTEPSSAGYEFFGQQIEITAPSATPADPLVIRFDIDASIVPVGQDETTIAMMRNGVAVPNCTGADGEADPDPCISDRSIDGDGDISITVLTSQASTWNMAIVAAVSFEFGGFEPPVTGDAPNRATAGSAIPVKFSLGGYRGMDIFSAGSPSVRLLSCATLAAGELVEQTVTAGASSLAYDQQADRYTYVWKTNRAWANTCRKLVLDFTDGSQAVANFDFRR